MEKLAFDYSTATPFFQPVELEMMQPAVTSAASLLESGHGPGNDFLGWRDLPRKYDKNEFRKIKAAAKKIRRDSEVLVVIGIGGSYLGAKAAIDFCGHTFHNLLPRKIRSGPEIYFAGASLSSTYHAHLLELIGERDFSINVISKSGTTTEPAIAFRLLKEKLEQRYGKGGASSRIYATTDRAHGALKKLADQAGYTTFVVPDDVGGRFSVLTAVGLLPIAAAGIDINDLVEGARQAMQDLKVASLMQNSAYQYAALRNIFYRKGKNIEMLVSYEPRCQNIAEWWKQLYGESEGKDGKGIFPASACFTTDLHSLGQYIQDGRRHLFETVLHIDRPERDLTIPFDRADLDCLNYLSGRTVDFVNKKAMEGTRLAHTDGGVPVLNIHLPEATAFHLGYLFYFFEKACALSGYLLGVNPFDQPGVEAYKKNMFRLLGKS